MHGLSSHLMDTDFDTCFSSTNIEFVWYVLKSIIHDAMHLFIPKIKLKSSANPKWFTPNISHSLNCLRTLRKRFSKYPTDHIKAEIEILESELKAKISSAKSVYEANLITRFGPQNPSKIYKYIRSITGSYGLPVTVYHNSHSASLDYEKSCLFNSHFHSMFTQSSFTLPPMGELPSPKHLCSNIVFSEDVFKALTSLDPSKAKGCDNIGPKVLKYCAQALYQPISHLPYSGKIWRA